MPSSTPGTSGHRRTSGYNFVSQQYVDKHHLEVKKNDVRLKLAGDDVAKLPSTLHTPGNCAKGMQSTFEMLYIDNVELKLKDLVTINEIHVPTNMAKHHRVHLSQSTAQCGHQKIQNS